MPERNVEAATNPKKNLKNAWDLECVTDGQMYRQAIAKNLRCDANLD